MSEPTARVSAAAYTAGIGDPVPRHRRNPRRGYDSEGRMILPATIANSQANGAYAIRAECACGHEAEVPIEQFPPDSFVPDAGLKLTCSVCGRKGSKTAPAWRRVSDRA